LWTKLSEVNKYAAIPIKTKEHFVVFFDTNALEWNQINIVFSMAHQLILKLIIKDFIRPEEKS
jgi:hypothetical protein